MSAQIIHVEKKTTVERKQFYYLYCMKYIIDMFIVCIHPKFKFKKTFFVGILNFSKKSQNIIEMKYEGNIDFYVKIQYGYKYLGGYYEFKFKTMYIRHVRCATDRLGNFMYS